MSEIPAFILEGRCRYRNGEAARVLATDIAGQFPVVSAGTDGFVRYHHKGGVGQTLDFDHDLVEIPAEPAKPREWWILPEAGPKDLPRLFTSLPEGVDSEGYIRVVEVPPGWSDPRPPEDQSRFEKFCTEFDHLLSKVSDEELCDAFRKMGCEVVASATQEPTSKPLPPGIPQPPEGFEYWGVGPLKWQLGRGGKDVSGIYPGNPEWEIGDIAGSSSICHYALRIGSEIHRLNSGEVGS